MKDLHNIATRAKQTGQESITTSSSEVQDLSNWLTQQYPGLDCEFVVNENNILSGLFLQDAEMKSTFSRFPEIILADSTYKTNNLNMALNVLLCVDGHGESHLVCAFPVANEDKVSLEDMLCRFKARNPKWTDITTVITDKDNTDRCVFKGSTDPVCILCCPAGNSKEGNS